MLWWTVRDDGDPVSPAGEQVGLVEDDLDAAEEYGVVEEVGH